MPIQIAKGQVIEYLIYGAEGFFTIRIDGREYTASQELFESVEPVATASFIFQSHHDFTLKQLSSLDEPARRVNGAPDGDWQTD